MSEEGVKLKRTITLPLIIAYGLGTMIGGGIYALTGKVAGEAGMYAPASFAIAAILALITAFSYAELVARHPYSSGEARYVHHAFGKEWFTKLIGWLVVFMGVVSAAALATAAAGFLMDITPFSEHVLTFGVVFILGSIALWGISESVIVIALITLIEVGGLLFVIATSGDALQTLPERWPELIPPLDVNSFVVWSSIAGGAFLAFYAFIGFEDMVNVAEEVKNVQRNMPIAIISCILLTLFLYVSISVVSVLSVAPDILAKSNTPLAEILKHNGSSMPSLLMVLISLLAVINGALVQIIMASRVIYGMASAGRAPALFGEVSSRTHTPIRATILAIIAVFLLAIFADLTTLAKTTSAIILFVFAAINAALIKIKRDEGDVQKNIPNYSVWIPWLGLITCLAMLGIGLLGQIYNAT